MADRLPSDHDAIETCRATVSTVGSTDRPQVELPETLAIDEGTIARFVLDGDAYYGRVERSLDGEDVVRRVGDNRRLAREGDGTNRLVTWFDAVDVSFGGSIHLDVVTPGYEYGLRSPGTRIVYTPTDAPDPALADIAANLDG